MTLLRCVPVALLACLALPAAASAGRSQNAAYDVRLTPARADITAPVSAATRALTTGLRRRLGREGVVQIDPLTGTPRVIAKLDGFLTGPLAGKPAAIALRWAKQNLGVEADGLRLLRQDTDPAGVTHLIWQQTVNGIPSLDTTLRAAVDKQGRLVWAGGSPLPVLDPNTTVPKLSATGALARAATLTRTALALPPRLLGKGRFTHGHSAKLVLVNFGDEQRLAWQVWLDAASDTVWDVIVDARTGELIRRVNRVLAAGQVKAWDNYPGAAKGGNATNRDVARYLSASDRLQGPYTHVFTDTEDDDVAQADDEVAPSGGGDWLRDFTPVPSPLGQCPTAGCSWNHLLPNSWQTNLAQNAQQVFYFITKFADHLKAAPVGFDKASGNFEGDDAIEANATDGAASLLVIPNPLTNAVNANMLTPADGTPARMQMYLFEPIPVLAPEFSDINGGDDASIVFHEFTHGLTNRLVLDGGGNGALLSPQASAMGEAWSDFYAMDFLISQGFETDTDAPGELKVGAYTDQGMNRIRTEPIDCTLGAPATACPRTGAEAVPQQGGYAYDAFGKIAGGPEPHADGEIWAQTLTEIRRALIAKHGAEEGERRTLAYVTGGLRLSPPEPSFLDMRNSILLTDSIAGRRDHDLLWDVFRRRGMGYLAQATSGFDETPVADFTAPPAANAPVGSVAGSAVDADGGAPLAGVPAGVSGHFSELSSDFAAVTGVDGKFLIGGIPAGSYGRMVVGGVGYEPVALDKVTVAAGQTAGPFDAKLKRNWAMLSGGAKVISRQGRDLGCGPALALDANPKTGIEVPPPTDAREPGPKAFVVKLPAPVDVKQLVIDPTENCFDDPTSALAGYKVEFSQDGTAWTTIAEGTFTPADRRPNDIPVADSARSRVRFVRMTMKSPMGLIADPTTLSMTYLEFMDMTELSIYGTSADKTAPTVSLDVADGAVLRGPQAKISGKVSDDIEVTRARLNGGSLAFAADGRFSRELTLARGANTLTLEAYDGTNNRGAKSVSVLGDFDAPKLTKLKATRASRRRGRLGSTVSGRVADDIGVRTVRVGARTATISKTGRFSLRVRVSSRTRTVRVKATDRAGRTTSVKVRVRRAKRAR